MFRTIKAKNVGVYNVGNRKSQDVSPLKKRKHDNDNEDATKNQPSLKKMKAQKAGNVPTSVINKKKNLQQVKSGNRHTKLEAGNARKERILLNKKNKKRKRWEKRFAWKHGEVVNEKILKQVKRNESLMKNNVSGKKNAVVENVAKKRKHYDDDIEAKKDQPLSKKAKKKEKRKKQLEALQMKVGESSDVPADVGTKMKLQKVKRNVGKGIGKATGMAIKEEEQSSTESKNRKKRKRKPKSKNIKSEEEMKKVKRNVGEGMEKATGLAIKEEQSSTESKNRKKRKRKPKSKNIK